MTPPADPMIEGPRQPSGDSTTVLNLADHVPATFERRVVATTLIEAPETGERAASTSLLHLWTLLTKWRWPIAALALLGVAAGVFVTLTTTPIYRATTTIQINMEPAKVQALQTQPSYEFDDPEKYYLTQYELLKSRTLAQRVARSAGLADDPAFLHPHERRPFWRRKAPAKPEGTYDQRLAAATSRVQAGLSIDPIQSSRLVKISYNSPDPAEAAKIANAMADSYISWNLERRYDASASARQFLQQRLAQTRAALEAAQIKGNAYAQANKLIDIGVGPTSGSSGAPGAAAAAPSGESIDAADLAAMDQSLSAAIAARIQAEQVWRGAQSTPNSALPQLLSDPAYQALLASRNAAEADYQQNLRLYKPDFPTMVDAKAKIDALNVQIAAVAKSVRGSLQSQYQTALRNEKSLQGQVAQRKSQLLASQAKRVGEGFINTDITTSQTLYDSMLASYKQIGIASAVQDNNISTVDKAQAPHGPIKPQPVHNLVLFGVAGLALGVMLAFVLEQFDLTLKTPEEAEKELGLPVLATIPNLPSNVSATTALKNPKSALSEGYYSARAALQLSTEDGVPSSLLITSAKMGEGKSTSALALASGFGRLGLRVLLVDADMRRPTQHRLLGCENTVGLSDMLTGGVDIHPALQPTGQPNLTFLAAGRPPPNPSELLAGRRMASFLESAREHFDIVIIDGPPMMGLADALQLASIVQGVLMIVEANATKRDIAKASLRRLRGARAHMLGLLFTKFNVKKAGYAYGHSHGYGKGAGYEYGVPPPRFEGLRGLARLGKPTGPRRDG